MRVWLMLLAGAAAASASAPVFQNGAFVQAGGVNIDVGYYGSPAVYDWNSDGLKDLIVGVFDLGKIRLYLNSGTNQAPVFTTFTNLQADGVDISLPYG